MGKVFTIFLAFYMPLYQPLSDITFKSCFKDSASIENNNLNYQYCDNSYYSHVEISRKIVNDSNLIFEFIKSQGMTTSDVYPIEILDIFSIEDEIINDSSRFKKKANEPKSWGLYDPRVAERTKSAIMITDHGKANDIILAHELSHYWYDRLCLNKQWHGTSEEFAMKFETYFLANK